MIVVFNPTTGARAELLQLSSSDQASTWSWRIAYRGREVLGGECTLTNDPSHRDGRVAGALTHALRQAAAAPTISAAAQDAIRSLVREL